jgi:hypothetical protein
MIRPQEYRRYMAYLFEHTKFGFCWLDLLALLILLAVIVVFGVRNRDLKKQQKDLEDQLDDLYSGDAKKDNSVIQE